jgi:hypothetical protein
MTTTTVKEHNMKFKIYDIDWDTETDDGEGPVDQLPTEYITELNGQRWEIVPEVGAVTLDDVTEDIINVMSDIHGWCINDCKIERIN